MAPVCLLRQIVIRYLPEFSDAKDSPIKAKRISPTLAILLGRNNSLNTVFSIN